MIWHTLVAAHDWLNHQPFLISVAEAVIFYWWGFRNGKLAEQRTALQKLKEEV